jgi:sugar phosphate isomerase/epimerase
MEPRVGEIISNTDALVRLMDAVGDENFGAILDTAHLHAQKEILVLSVEKMAGRIYYLHVADNDGRENQHLALGDGTIDWRGLFACLRKHRFDGYVAIDVGRIPEVDDAYRRSLRFLRDLEKDLAI